MFKSFLVLCSAFMLVSLCQAQDSHQVKTDALVRKYIQDAREVVNGADKIDLDLQRFGQKSKYAEQARLVARNMVYTAAWKDLRSRETRKNRSATIMIDRMFELANNHLVSGRKELAVLEEAEYAEWAKAHPEEAKSLDMQRRLQAAEEAAKNAALKAQAAEDAAKRASEEAIEAQRRDVYVNVTPPPKRGGHLQVTIDPNDDGQKDQDKDKQGEPGRPHPKPKPSPPKKPAPGGDTRGPSSVSP